MPLEQPETMTKDLENMTKPVPTAIYEICKIHDFPKDFCPYCKDLEIEILKLELSNTKYQREIFECTSKGLFEEIERLKSGNFTPEELQNLCHNLSCDECKLFIKGCRDYQMKLFGYKKVRKALDELYVEWVKDFVCKECGSYPNPDGCIDHHRGCSREGMIDRVEELVP
jgi:hypothetical protein